MSGSSTYHVPESYFLINQAVDSSRVCKLSGIPPGTYDHISFMIGVDEKRNTSGAQTGVLDPVNAMFWDWSSGYIMAMMEGDSPQAVNTFGILGFHIAGYSGQYATQRMVTLKLPDPITVREGALPLIYINADLLEWFKTPNTIQFGQYGVIVDAGARAAMIADNYMDMFSVDHVEN